MPFKVVLMIWPSRVPPDFGDKVKKLGAEFSLVDCRKEEDRVAAGSDADFIICPSNIYYFNRSMMERLAKCRFIESTGVGYDGLDVEAATELGIGIIHNVGLCTEELSDHAMAMILAHSRWIIGLNERVKAGKLIGSANPEAIQRMIILRGKTIGLIGFGNSGRAIVPKAKGFGMKVIAYQSHADNTAAKQMGVELVSLERLLTESDFISIHANLSYETRHLLGINEFKKMKPNCFIANTARGGIIDEKALCMALEKGYIAGAGLDVTDPEPTDLNSPLLRFDNVILTGHQGGNSPESSLRQWSFPVEQVRRAMNHEWPDGIINPEVKDKYMSKWERLGG